MIRVTTNRYVFINARNFYVFDLVFGPILTIVHRIRLEFTVQSTVHGRSVNHSPWRTCVWNRPSSDRASAGPDRLALPPQTVDLWWGWLGPGANGAYQLLSPGEQQRADRLGANHRSQFIQGRAQLRRILSAYLGQAAETIGLSQTGKPQTGKPSLIDGSLQFNLSHCQNRVIYAISHGPIGIDLERADRPVRSPLGLAQRFLGPGEIAAIAASQPDRQREIFLKHWVCKEAVIKAQGRGLAHQLRADHVQLEPEPRLTIGAPWQLVTLQPDLNHWSTIVHHGPIAQVRTYGLDQNGMISGQKTDPKRPDS
jgi:4'-phosphopantetheinyl transferase